MNKVDELKVALACLSREELNDFEVVDQPAVENEADHFYICQHCGQAVDYRRLGDVLYHDEPDHKPLALN